jgi:hypothetical protein
LIQGWTVKKRHLFDRREYGWLFNVADPRETQQPKLSDLRRPTGEGIAIVCIESQSENAFGPISRRWEPPSKAAHKSLSISATFSSLAPSAIFATIILIGMDSNHFLNGFTDRR